MIIVSDTTPFRYLIEAGTVDILATLFGQATFRVAPKLYQDLRDRDALRQQARQSGT